MRISGAIWSLFLLGSGLHALPAEKRAIKEIQARSDDADESVSGAWRDWTDEAPPAVKARGSDDADEAVSGAWADWMNEAPSTVEARSDDADESVSGAWRDWVDEAPVDDAAQ